MPQYPVFSLNDQNQVVTKHYQLLLVDVDPVAVVPQLKAQVQARFQQSLTDISSKADQLGSQVNPSQLKIVSLFNGQPTIKSMIQTYIDLKMRSKADARKRIVFEQQVIVDDPAGAFYNYLYAKALQQHPLLWQSATQQVNLCNVESGIAVLENPALAIMIVKALKYRQRSTAALADFATFVELVYHSDLLASDNDQAVLKPLNVKLVDAPTENNLTLLRSIKNTSDRQALEMALNDMSEVPSVPTPSMPKNNFGLPF